MTVGSAPFPLPLARAATGVFVGRDAELARLQAAWRERRRLVLLAGEAGIGKTRLAVELARTVHDEGATVLFGRCDEVGGDPYQPCTEAVRARIATTSSAAEAGGPYLTALVPELALATGRSTPPTSGDPATDRLALFDSVARALGHSGPTLLVIDDLHWAPEPTLLLLRHLLRARASADVIVVATYRDTDIHLGHPLSHWMAEVRQDVDPVRLTLSGLDGAAVVDYVEVAAGHPLDAHERTFADLVHDRTDGHPFFVVALLRHLVETGAVSRTDGHWRADLAAVERSALPEGVRDAVTFRLGRLTDAAARVLAAAAVVGPEFSLSILERLPGLADPDLVLEAVEHAERVGLVTEAGVDRYAFTHALIRQALHDELLSTRRVRLHRQIGEAIESLPGTDVQAEVLAHHFAEAAADGRPEKAVDYALVAARRAIERLAPETACGHLERGLAVIDLAARPDERRRADLLLALAESRYVAGDVEGAQEAAVRAADVARGVDPRRFAEAVVRLASRELLFHASGNLEDLYEEARDGLGDDDVVLRARLAAGFARHVAWAKGDPDGALPIAVEAAALARGGGDPAALAAVLASCATVIYLSHDARATTAIVGELVTNAEAVGDHDSLAQGLLLRAVSRLQAGDRAGFDADVSALTDLGERLRAPLVLADAAILEAIRALFTGRFDEVPALHARIHASAGDNAETRSATIVQMGQLLFEAGRLQELIGALTGFLQVDPALGAMMRATLAHVQGEAGELGAARALIEELAPDDFAALPRDGTRPHLLGLLAAPVARVGDVEKASVLYGLLEPMSGTLNVGVRGCCFGAYDRYLGLLAATMRDPSAAEVHFAAAIEMEGRVGARPLLARTLLAFSTMLAVHHEPGARQRAAKHLAESLAIAEELGMAAVVAEINASMR